MALQALQNSFLSLINEHALCHDAETADTRCLTDTSNNLWFNLNLKAQ